MIIVTQDKEAILNFENSTTVIIKETLKQYDIVSHLTNGRIATLGEYKTKERAKEVLQEIIEKIQNKSFVEMNSEGLTTGLTGGIYEMPKEW